VGVGELECVLRDAGRLWPAVVAPN
jgi:hypothetical protein